jgi:hypothetical protein
MVQAIDNPIAANFLTDAVVERHNFSQLNKTRIRFRIQLKKSTKSAAPKWADVLKAEVSEIESDLVKVTNSEVGLRGIKVFKKLDEAAAQLRQEIASVQEWMSADTGDWVCPKLMLAYGQRIVRAKAAELQERFGECAIAESTNGSLQTLRLTFAGHQEVKQFVRR